MGVDDGADSPRPRISSFRIERIETPPVLDSSIPQSITDAIIQSEDLPDPLPDLGSSIIEDFIARKIQGGIAASEAIADAFVQEDYPGKIDQYMHELQTQSEALNWDQIFSPDDYLEVKSKIAAEMRDLGMTEDQITAINDMGVDMTDSTGASSLDDQNIYISKLQTLRRALDYQKVFGADIPVEEIIKTMMTVTAGHELGHQIDHVTPGYAVNKIPADPAWFKDGKTDERKDERFSEYWGRVALGEDEEKDRMRQRDWVLQVAKTNQVWSTVKNYNAYHEPKVELFTVFSALRGKLASGNKQTLPFLESRIGIYSGNAAQNYASAYPRETISA